LLRKEGHTLQVGASRCSRQCCMLWGAVGRAATIIE